MAEFTVVVLEASGIKETELSPVYLRLPQAERERLERLEKK